MRALAFGALAAATFAAAAQAQQVVDSGHGPQMDSRLRMEIGLVRSLFGSIHAPTADSFSVGNRDVGAGTSIPGSVAVARGNLEVHGRVAGDAIALHGDVIVYPGGSVARNAIAIDGRVRTLGGVVEGDVRSIRGIAGGLLAKAGGNGTSNEPVTTWEAVKVVIGWFAVLFAIGIGVLLFAEANLDGVVRELEVHFSRAFWTGVLTELAILPLLAVGLVGLALSIIGILLIPFAVVAYVVALAGLLTLGFIAVARFTGRAFSKAGASTRGISLRSLFAGLILYLGLWLLAAVFTWSPIAGSMLRAVALAGSWVALTFGLGATILSRAGTRRDGERARKQEANELSWQTPTPVTGVVAARRPVAQTK